MSTLDLHGTKHAEVEDRLTRYFFWEKPGHNQYDRDWETSSSPLLL